MTLAQPVFLGICFRAQVRLRALDLLGVTSEIRAPFVPMVLCDQALVLAIPHIDGEQSYKFSIFHESDPSNRSCRSLKVNTNKPPDFSRGHSLASGATTRESGQIEYSTHAFRPASSLPYHLVAHPIPTLPVSEPGVILVTSTIDEVETQIGSFAVRVVPPPPIDEEERTKLIERFGERKGQAITYNCTVCKDKISLFVTLNPSVRGTDVPANAVTPDEAPDEWVCRCGQIIDLRYLKMGMHELLRHPARPDGVAVPTFTQEYETNAVERVSDDYRKLIDSDPEEEAVQQFLKHNLIVWSFLAPKKVIAKPPVLTKRRADYAILAANRILYLVEIEKPRTLLAKKSGGQHSELQAGIDQIRDWRIAIGDHRIAFLNELGFRQTEVQDIRYILVAGMARLTDRTALETLRRNPPNGIEFYTFDDLSFLLENLAASFRHL